MHLVHQYHIFGPLNKPPLPSSPGIPAPVFYSTLPVCEISVELSVTHTMWLSVFASVSMSPASLVSGWGVMQGDSV